MFFSSTTTRDAYNRDMLVLLAIITAIIAHTHAQEFDARRPAVYNPTTVPSSDYICMSWGIIPAASREGIAAFLFKVSTDYDDDDPNNDDSQILKLEVGDGSGVDMTRVKIEGLKNGVTYWVAMSAIMINGDQSAYSLSGDITLNPGFPPCDVGLPTPKVTLNPLPAPKAPTSPLNVRVEPGDAMLCIFWDEPESNGGSPIFDYTVEVLPNREDVIDLTAKFGPPLPQSTIETSKEVWGLTNDYEYKVTVKAGTLPDGIGYLDSPKSNPVLATTRASESCGSGGPSKAPVDMTDTCNQTSFRCIPGQDSIWSCVQNFLTEYCL